MWILKLLVILCVVLLGAGLATLNGVAVRLDYYFGIVALPLSVTLVGALVVGALLGVVASLGMTLEARRENGRLRRKVRLIERELGTLRSLPLQDRPPHV